MAGTQQMHSKQVTAVSNSAITSEQARNARARAWAYVFQCWHAKKGDCHDLTNNSTPKTMKNGPRTKEQEKT
jgi:hypothetical protein